MLNDADICQLKDIFVTRKECDDITDGIEKTQHKTEVTLAEVNTKLGIIMAVLGAVGVAILALVIKQFWGGIMTKCSDCKEARNVERVVPIMQKLFTIIIVLVIVILLNNVAWIYAWCQYDYTSYEITAATDGNASYIGGNGDIANSGGGDINYGEDQSKDQN